MRKIIDNNKPESFKDFRIGFGKRSFDVIFSVLAILVSSPFMLLIGICIKIESKGPIVYKSIRVGSGYDMFTFYKFRSMRRTAEAEREKLSDLNLYLINKHHNESLKKQSVCPECERLGRKCSPTLYIEGTEICENWYLELKKRMSDLPTFFKVKDDPRVTWVGRIIRRTNLDELPQFFNVLKGDMSIVGNRPLPLYEAEKLTSDQLAYRFLSPAGITGMWQISHNRFQSEEDRIKLDNMYAMVSSPKKDLEIVLKTFLTVLDRHNY